MKCNINLGFGCVFKVQKINAEGDIVYDGPEFHNTMLSSGLLKLYTVSLQNMSAYINIGSGTSAPSSGQTGLDNRLFSTSSIYNSSAYWTGGGVIDEKMYIGYCRVFQFNVGTCTGTFSEVGLSRASNVDYLNRQLLRNEYGVPTTITVAANEGIRITAEVRCYIDNIIKPYSEVYCIETHLCNTQDKSITLTNGTTQYTISLNNYIYDLAKIINLNIIKKGVNSLYCYTSSYTNFNDDNNVIYLFGHPLNTEALNLSMVSNTITDLGGGDPFEFTCIKPFMGKQSIINNVEYYDDVTGATQSVEFELFQMRNTSGYTYPAYLTTGYGNPSSNGCYNTDGAVTLLSSFIDQPLSSWQMKASDPNNFGMPLNVSSSTVLSDPSISNLSYKIKSYYSPGAIGSGTKTVNGFYIARSSDSVYNKFYQYVVKMKNFELTVTDIEEFWTEMTFSWGAA